MQSATALSPLKNSARALAMTDGAIGAGFGIYLHWPYCLAKCPYCDFNSHVARSVNQRDWAKAFVSELEHYALETPERVVNSVFFGGGTPSLMEPALVETIIACIAENWRLAQDVEISLEANPTSIETGKFRDFRAAGINRVSVGIQALNDNDLRRLGRQHDHKEALAAIDIARNVFTRTSFDLIYARQDQTLSEWEAELSRALSLDLDHLSLYQLTIEPETVFGRRFAANRLAGLPDDDLSAEMYEVTQDICEAAGLPAYEVSNHARPWAQSRHNMIYWRSGDYLGIGPGAHGRLTLNSTRYATDTELNPDIWRLAAEGGVGEKSRVMLSETDRVTEYVMMSLRLSEGVDLARLKRMGGALNVAKVDELTTYGLLLQENNRLIVTKSGRMVLNAITRTLLLD